MYIKKQDVCFGCPCFNQIGSYCNLTEHENEKPCDTILSDCPLPISTLPKVHGDLIDIEDLKSMLLHMWTKNENYTISDIFRDIPDLPVVVKASNR